MKQLITTALLALGVLSAATAGETRKNSISVGLTKYYSDGLGASIKYDRYFKREILGIGVGVEGFIHRNDTYMSPENEIIFTSSEGILGMGRVLFHPLSILSSKSERNVDCYFLYEQSIGYSSEGGTGVGNPIVLRPSLMVGARYYFMPHLGISTEFGSSEGIDGDNTFSTYGGVVFAF